MFLSLLLRSHLPQHLSSTGMQLDLLPTWCLTMLSHLHLKISLKIGLSSQLLIPSPRFLALLPMLDLMYNHHGQLQPLHTYPRVKCLISPIHQQLHNRRALYTVGRIRAMSRLVDHMAFTWAAMPSLLGTTIAHAAGSYAPQQAQRPPSHSQVPPVPCLSSLHLSCSVCKLHPHRCTRGIAYQS